MKQVLFVALALLAGLAIAVFPMAAYPGWPDSAPTPPPIHYEQRTQAGYRWVTYPENEGQAFLFFGSATVGGWDHELEIYRPFDGLQWGTPRATAPITPPVPSEGVLKRLRDRLKNRKPKIDQPPLNAPPATPKIDQRPTPRPAPAPNIDQRPVTPARPVPNFGVDTDKLHGQAVEPVRYWHNGKEVTRSEAIEQLRRPRPKPTPAPLPNDGKQLVDDRGKLCLTVIGAQADRTRTLTAIGELPAATKAKVKVWSVDPSHWSVAGLGYVTSGTPTVYLQTPDGRVLYRDDTGSIEAIRKAVDGYDPKKDPSPTRPAAANLVPPIAWLAGGALLATWGRRKQAGVANG